MFRRILIANRGAIACRIIRTLRKMNVEAVAVYSDADVGSLHVSLADQAVRIGPPPAAQSYLSVPNLLEAAHKSGAHAIHPGYGFLSENASFAEACEANSLVFIGPTPQQILDFGLKNTARDLAVASGLPILPGTGLLSGLNDALSEASKIGYPVMLKSAGGGGGIGMRRCNDERELAEAFDIVSRLSDSHFKGSGLFLEKYIRHARHIEVQAFGDGTGRVVSLGERDCSIQRRNQKIIEETPAPNLSQSVREMLHQSAVRLLAAIAYRSAGTVEFIYDTSSEKFYFLEVNSRLQVEHGVTEEVFGIDLVEWMVRLAADEMPSLDSLSLESKGASIQARLYAENPLEDFSPSSGRITHFSVPTAARCDTWIQTGTEITPFYDPLLAKIVCRGATRPEAIAELEKALSDTRLSGLESNLEFLRQIISSAAFASGSIVTDFLSHFTFVSRKIKVLEPGVITTVQDLPGRIGYWSVGVPPSGPMDSLNFRLANRILGNAEGSPALECTLSGPKLQFFTATRIAVTGADMQPTVNGIPIRLYASIDIDAGDILALQGIRGCGARTYIAIENGLEIPLYLGSAATFTLGNFGGHAGRALRAGDYLSLSGESLNHDAPAWIEDPPELTSDWRIGVLYGPQGAPDFLQSEYLSTFFEAKWRVHHNSSRTGVRLIGPKPGWARRDGGDAGLHPSNIHDNAYAIGAIDFTGDMPVILGPDGPSLGGFVSPAVVVDAELWKVGQLSPGDNVQFVRVSEESARKIAQDIDSYVYTLKGNVPELREDASRPAVINRNAVQQVVTRASGDRYILVEFGDAVLDLNLRFRVFALMQALESKNLEGILDLTPGIRSLQVHYDPNVLERERLLRVTDGLVCDLISIDRVTIPSRIVHLPLSWNDPATQLAIERYMASVRPDAPWCPSNLEFIRRINGLSSIEEVRQIVFDASYIVLGLGDVYLGAPVATPLDPRHRLVTTKYNPARTWTPENAVGIGGAYLCVYGMEGPGGYQFVGRTVQMWNTYRTTRSFEYGKPWLLRFFDQIKFYPVSAEELLEMRREFPLGRTEIRIEHSRFQLHTYREFLESIDSAASAFRNAQQLAFAEERQRWTKSGEFDALLTDELPPDSGAQLQIPAGCAALTASTTASVWQVLTSPGDRIVPGQKLFVLEAMKMEIGVHAAHAGEVVQILCSPGSLVSTGQPLLIYRPTE